MIYHDYPGRRFVLMLQAIVMIMIIDHIIRDPVTGKHYFTWRRM